VSYDQRLPLPLGDRNPIRRYGRLWFVSGRDRFRALLLAVGVTAAVSGGLLGARTPEVSVTANNEAYSLGTIRLPAQGNGIYSGPQGAVVIQEQRAGASTTLHGLTVLGTCTLDPNGRSESCYFQLGNQALRATDQRTPTGWHRRYQDGQELDIALPNGTVPVPFPLGR
jgi:hypothetical protein